MKNVSTEIKNFWDFNSYEYEVFPRKGKPKSRALSGGNKMTIETDNATEEIKEIVEKCIKCGRCKNLCPVFKVMREEQYSPRGKAIILENNYL